MIGRMEKMRHALKTAQVDAVQVSNPLNIRYLSGFTGSSGQLFITQKEACLITDFRYQEQAAAQATDYVILSPSKKIEDTLTELCEAAKVRYLGFEEEYLSFHRYERYSSVLKGIHFVPFSSAFKKMRMIKEPVEIDRIKASVSLTDRAFQYILPMIKPGVSEKELALELEFFMKRNGAEEIAFPFIAASGERGAMPHGVATDKLLQKGELLTLDMGCILQGYCSDLTRTVCVGQPNRKQREIYQIVLAAQREALAQLRSGVSCAKADRFARDVIEREGFGSCFGHSLGHGLGLAVHEDPLLAKDQEQPLETGMVVTVEPGIYISGFGGVRIEDVVVILETGVENLTNSCKDFLVL